MDHDEIASDTTHGMWEPPGYDDSSSTVTEHDDSGASGYDGGGPYGSPDDSGTTDSSAGTDGSGTSDGGYDDGGSGTSGSGTMTVEVDGETRELPAEKDYTGDGRPDAAAETSDGKVIIFADTEDNATGDAGPDGKADEAYVIDKQTGQVVGAAHIDPDSGEWVEGVDNDGPSAVPHDTGDGGDTGQTGGTGQTGTETTGSGDGPDVVTVEAGGHTIGVVETVDTDGDGEADSGVIYADGRAVVVTNTDDDPEAEQVAVVDPETGQVVEVAHVNPETGEWEEGPAPGYGEGSGSEGSGGSGGTEGGEGTGTEGTEVGTTTGDGSMTVEVEGQTRELPADKDYTGDGRPDAATETSDGKVIIFADTENNETGEAGPDGKADEAYVVDKQTGQVVGAAHVDPNTGEWVDGMDTDGASAVPSGSGQGS